jgi:hypothetical protein
LDERTVRVQLLSSARPMSWRQVLHGWREDQAVADALGGFLADLDFKALRWETPAMTNARLNKPFECVAVGDPSLAVEPDPEPFSEHLREDREVVCFENLGGDALLVVPCPWAEWTRYAHFAAFLRGAPARQQRALWRMVASVMTERVGERPVWLNTAGGGVAWLHVRLDDRPKYYAHAPYRSQPTHGGA